MLQTKTLLIGPGRPKINIFEWMDRLKIIMIYLNAFLNSLLHVNVLEMMEGKKKKKQEELGSLPKMCFQVGFLKLCTLFNFIHGWARELGTSALTYSHSKVYPAIHLLKWFFNVKYSMSLPNSANYFPNGDKSMTQIKCLFLSYFN